MEYLITPPLYPLYSQNANSHLHLPGPLNPNPRSQTPSLPVSHGCGALTSAPSRRRSHLDATQMMSTPFLRRHHHPNPLAAAQSMAFGLVLVSYAKENTNNP